MLKKQIKWLRWILGIDMALAAGLLCLIQMRSSEGEEWQASSGDEYVEPKVVALTFDDGPDRKYTEQLLDGLKERGVKVSFFLLGACITGNEDLVKRMDEEGHLIGVHSMEHVDLTRQTPEQAFRQIRETGVMIEQITGDAPEYIRPPFGNWNENLDTSVAETLGLIPAFWSVDSMDWKLQNTSKITNHVLKTTEDGSIILMHDAFATSVEAAFGIIDNLTAKGYTFVTVDELMVD